MNGQPKKTATAAVITSQMTMTVVQLMPCPDT